MDETTQTMSGNEAQDSGYLPFMNVSTTTTPQVTIIKPKPFAAKPGENVNDWLELFEIAATANAWDAKVKRQRVGAYLEGTAQKWFINYHKKNETSEWAAFLNELQICFGFQNKMVASLDELQSRKMTMGEKFEDYYFDKIRLCEQYNSNMTDLEKVSHIIKGLTPTLIDRAYADNCQTPQALFNKLKWISEGANIAHSTQQWSVAQNVQPEAALAALPQRGRSNRGFRGFRRGMRTALAQMTRAFNRMNFGYRRGNRGRWRNSYQKPYVPRNDNQNQNQDHNQNQSQNQPQNNQNSQTNQEQQNNQQRDLSNTRCYNCERYGHYARDCRGFRGRRYQRSFRQRGRGRGNYRGYQGN